CAHIPVAVGVGRSAPSQPSPGWTFAPSAAYPLSPRRREIIRPPLLDRARGRRARERSSIYSGSSACGERRQEKDIRRMPPFKVTTIHDGVVVLPLFGVILLSRHVHRLSGSTKPSVKHGSSKRL